LAQVESIKVAKYTNVMVNLSGFWGAYSFANTHMVTVVNQTKCVREKNIAWFSQHRNAASQRGGGEGLRLQSQEGQDLCAAVAAGHLMFKTSTEDLTVDLTNKGMTKDSERFSPWFHSACRTNGPIL
jgi:hypothetical protein